MGVNVHRQLVTLFHVALLQDQRTKRFKWLFTKFLEAIDGTITSPYARSRPSYDSCCTSDMYMVYSMEGAQCEELIGG